MLCKWYIDNKTVYTARFGSAAVIMDVLSTNTMRVLVLQGDGLWEETIQVSACFGMKCSVAFTSGEELEQVVCGMSVKVLGL